MKKNLIVGLIIILMLFFNSSFGADFSEKRIYANDAAKDDLFGFAVAGSGNRFVVGARSDGDRGINTGAVYLYENIFETWTQKQKFIPTEGDGNDFFGSSVAIDGNYLVVGAPECETMVNYGAGFVYVYEYNGVTWSDPQKLTPANGASGDGFGHSVAISGDYILVGSYKHDLTGKDDAGAVYVYKKGALSWEYQKKITLDVNAAVGDNFGVSVSLFGDRALVGAYKKDGPDNEVDMGAAYIFDRDGEDWLFTKKLSPDESTAYLNFGKCVSLYENYAVVGSPTNSKKTSGFVYVFHHNGTTWNQETKFAPAVLPGENWWGTSVAIENNKIIGGDYSDGDHGAVYIYEKDASIWNYIQKITPTDAQPSDDDKFGCSVALSSGKIIVGARDGLAKEGGSAIEMAGAAYIYSAVGPPPVVADFSANVTAGFAPLAVSFTDISTGAPTSWEWNFGDHNSSDDQNPTHTFTSPGIYTVTLKASNTTSENTATKENYISVRVQQPENFVWTSFSRETMFAGANQNNVNAMCYNRFDGNVIVGTSGGVAEFSGVYWRHYQASDNADSLQVNAVAVDSSGAKWFGLSSGARVFGSDTTKHDPTESRVNDIFVQSNGHVWMATNNGLAYYDGADWTVYTTANSGLSVNNINRVTMDKNEDVLIVSTQGGGLCVLEGESWETYTTDQGLTDNILYNTVLDWNWNAWVAPDSGGIIKFEPDSATAVYKPLGTGENDLYFSAVGLDSSGNVWAAGQHSGIARFDGVAWTHLDTSNSDLSSNLVRSKDILVEPNGAIWFGTRDAGVCRFGQALTQSVDFYADVTSGYSPLTVHFYGASTVGTPDYWLWDFDNDGVPEIIDEQNPSYTFDTPGDYTVRLSAPVGSVNFQKIKTGYISVISSGGETGSLNGQVTDTATGNPIANVTVTLGDSTTTTDGGGNYSFTNISVADLIADFTANPRTGKAPLTVQFTDQSGYGRQLLTASATGYSDFSTYISISPTGTTFDISLSPTIPAGGMRLVLNWSPSPQDLDIHLTTPEIEGTEYEIWSNEKGSPDSPPYVLLDVDAANGFGPETITIHQLKSGTYRCFVFNYSELPDLTGSAGVVQIYDSDGLKNTVTVPAAGTGLYWYVCDIDGANGNVTVVNTIQDTPPGGPSFSSRAAKKKTTSINNIDGTTGISDVTNWAWDFDNDGVVDDTTRNPSYTYPDAGTYSVKLMVSDANQSDNIVKTEYITVTPGDTLQSGTMSGKVTDATTGKPIVGATVSVAGMNTTTDSLGNYTFKNVPVGALTANFTGTPLSGDAPLTVRFTDYSGLGVQRVTASATGYYNYSRYISVSTSVTILNITLSPVFTGEGLRLVLNWDELPEDMDIHLLTPEIDGKPYEVFYKYKGSQNTPPYAVLDIDDTNGIGPETITVYSLVDGTYRCYVDKYSEDTAITSSNGVVQVYGTSGLMHTINVPTTGTGEYWYVCDIDGATGDVTIVNTLQSDPPGLMSVNQPLRRKNPPLANTNGTGENTAEIVSWAWDFNDDGSIDTTTQNPVYTYTTPGTYTVSLTVSDGTNSDVERKTDYITVTEKTQLQNYDVLLTGIDHQHFPHIKAYTAVLGSSRSPVKGLTLNNFTLTEDDVNVTIDSVKKISTQDPGELDIVVVIDVESGFATRLDFLKQSALEISDSLAANGLDCRFGLVAFRDKVVAAHDLTGDVFQFKMWLDALTVVDEDNDKDNSLEALVKASQLNFRNQAKRMTLLITDNIYHTDSQYTSFSAAQVINMLNENDITNHVIGYDNSAFRNLAANTGGLFFSVSEDFQITLDKFVSIMTSHYVLSYTTYNQTPTDSWRNVVIQVENLGYGGFDSGRYYVGSPRIALGPDKIPGIVESVFTLDIYAESIVNLYECNIYINFDSSALQFVDRNVGPFLGRDGVTVLDSTTVGANWVYINLDRFDPDSVSVSGSGILYSIRFRILKEYVANPFTFNFANLKTPSGTIISTSPPVTTIMESPYEYDQNNNKISKLRGDFDIDLDIDTRDFAMLATYWGQPDSIKGDIGPATGSLPFLTTTPDTLVNFEDLFVFTRMWNWYHLNIEDGGTLSKSAATLEWRIADDIQNSKTVHVDLWANDMNNLAMGHLLFKYDQATLKFENATAGELFSKGTSTVALFADNNDKTGFVDVAISRLADKENDPQVSGSGVIASLEFERVNLTAASTLELKDAEFRSPANKTFLRSDNKSIQVEGMNLPKTYALSQNYPNPFNYRTQLEYSLPKTSFVTIDIFNILGQPVRTLVDGRMDPGRHKIVWNGKNNGGLEVVSGIYFVRMKSNSFKKVREMLFLK